MMPDTCPLAPNVSDVYKQLGALAAGAEHRREAQEEIKETLEEIRRRLHDISNKLTPLLSDVEKNAKKLKELEVANEAREIAEAKQAGIRTGVGVGLALGGGATGAFLTKVWAAIFGG